MRGRHAPPLSFFLVQPAGCLRNSRFAFLSLCVLLVSWSEDTSAETFDTDLPVVFAPVSNQDSPGVHVILQSVPVCSIPNSPLNNSCFGRIEFCKQTCTQNKRGFHRALIEEFLVYNFQPAAPENDSTPRNFARLMTSSFLRAWRCHSFAPLPIAPLGSRSASTVRRKCWVNTNPRGEWRPRQAPTEFTSPSELPV